MNETNSLRRINNIWWPRNSSVLEQREEQHDSPARCCGGGGVLPVPTNRPGPICFENCNAYIISQNIHPSLVAPRWCWHDATLLSMFACSLKKKKIPNNTVHKNKESEWGLLDVRWFDSSHWRGSSEEAAVDILTENMTLMQLRWMFVYSSHLLWLVSHHSIWAPFFLFFLLGGIASPLWNWSANGYVEFKQKIPPPENTLLCFIPNVRCITQLFWNSYILNTIQ